MAAQTESNGDGRNKQTCDSIHRDELKNQDARLPASQWRSAEPPAIQESADGTYQSCPNRHDKALFVKNRISPVSQQQALTLTLRLAASQEGWQMNRPRQ